MPFEVHEPRYIFLQYAITETGEALRALGEVRRLTGVREQRQPGIEVLEWRSIIRELRSALTAAANVSKVLWSAKSGAPKARSAMLRKLCNLPDEHGLKSRSLRNHIEHIDERLDKWLEDGPRPFFVIEQVAHADPDWPPEKLTEMASVCVLVYDVATDTVILLGQSFILSELEEQISQVQTHLGYGFTELTKEWPRSSG